MTAKDEIREALKKFMTIGEANACQVWKGYSMVTGKIGWHYKPFDGQAVYIGKSKTQALETLEDIADSTFEP